MSISGEKKYALLLVFATLLVGILIFAAMFAYAVPYIWYNDYLSAMGCTRLPDGTYNFLSAFLFNSALIISGFFCGSYFYMRGIFCGNKFFAILLQISGVIGGVALAGIGSTPYNLMPELHNLCTYFASGGLGFGILLCATSQENRMSCVVENFLWALVTIYIAVLWLAWDYVRNNDLVPRSPTGEIMQKMMISLFYLYMLWNSIRYYLRCKSEKKNE